MIPAAVSTAFKSPLFAGGAAIGAVGGIVAWLRNLPSTAWHATLRRTTMSIDVVSADESFEWVTAWLDAQPYSKRARTLSAMTSRGSDGETELLMIPAPGSHFFFYERRPVWLTRERKDLDKDSGSLRGPRPETITIRIMGRQRGVLERLMTEARKVSTERSERAAKIYIWRYSDWISSGLVASRPLESVCLRDGVADTVLADMRKFLERGDWYRSMGVPHRRGYLFHGPPGTGKSSSVQALAAELKLDVYTISIGSRTLSDDTILAMMHDVTSRSIVLLEDIDAINASHTRVKPPKDEDDNDPFGGSTESAESALSLSGLLNALDGVAARDGVIVIMTSNHPSSLDPALTRPGRVDHKVLFDYADRNQVIEMFRRFYPDACDLAEEFADRNWCETLTPAQLQQHFLMHMDHPTEALNHKISHDV